MRKKLGIFLLSIMLVTSTIFVFQIKKVNATGKTSDGWWDDDWNYRKLITINSSQVDSTLTNFPVLINLASDPNLVAHAQPDGDDIVFVLDNDNTQLNHEIELFNGITGQLIAWVNVTSLSGSTDTEIYMYYGNSACSSQENAAGVWDSNYIAVWHLSETPTIDNYAYDSTSNSINGTFEGNMTSDDQVTGQIDGCLDFDGLDDNVDLPDGASSLLGGASAATISVWAKRSTIGTRDAIIDLTIIGIYSKFFLEFQANNRVRIGGRANSSDLFQSEITTSTFTNNTWYHIVGVLDLADDDIFIYNNGKNELTTGIPSWNQNTFESDVGSKHAIGIGAQVLNGLEGQIDELRISKVARSASWINTSYNTMNSPSTFISVGIEEIRSKIIISNPYPADGAINVELTPTMSIYVNHYSGNQMNITWKWNNAGSWDVFGTNYNVFDGTYNQINMNFSSYQTTYEWRVEVNDGIGNWMNETYSFTTTKDNEPPTVNITRPELGFIYVNVLRTQYRLKILPATSTLIIGMIDIMVNAIDIGGIDTVEFYINDVLRETLSEPPYKWTWNELTFFDVYNIEVVATDLSGNQKTAGVEVYKIQLFEISP